MSYYKAVDIIRETALATGLITTVTHGKLPEIDTKRQTLLPLVHIVPNNMNVPSRVVVYNFTIYFLDLVDFNKIQLTDVTNPFYGTDNMVDVFNQMSLAAQLFLDKLSRGNSNDQNIIAVLPSTATFISNSFENLLAGVEVTVQIEMPNSSVTDGIC